MQKARRLFDTIKLAGHCLAEQGYDATNLIKIADLVGQSCGLNSDAVGSDIIKTMEFHAEQDRQEREEKRVREKEIRQQKRNEDYFNSLSDLKQDEILKVNGYSFRKAVEFASKYKRKGEKQMLKSISREPKTETIPIAESNQEIAIVAEKNPVGMFRGDGLCPECFAEMVFREGILSCDLCGYCICE